MVGGSSFDIVAAADEESARVVVTGDLDVVSAPRFIKMMHELSEPPTLHIDVDCEGVQFLDSAGVRALIVAKNEAARRGVDLVVTQPSASVHRVLEMTGLSPLLTTPN